MKNSHKMDCKRDLWGCGEPSRGEGSRGNPGTDVPAVPGGLRQAGNRGFRRVAWPFARRLCQTMSAARCEIGHAASSRNCRGWDEAAFAAPSASARGRVDAPVGLWRLGWRDRRRIVAQAHSKWGRRCRQPHSRLPSARVRGLGLGTSIGPGGSILARQALARAGVADVRSIAHRSRRADPRSPVASPPGGGGPVRRGLGFRWCRPLTTPGSVARRPAVPDRCIGVRPAVRADPLPVERVASVSGPAWSPSLRSSGSAPLASICGSRLRFDRRWPCRPACRGLRSRVFRSCRGLRHRLVRLAISLDFQSFPCRSAGLFRPSDDLKLRLGAESFKRRHDDLSTAVDRSGG